MFRSSALIPAALAAAAALAQPAGAQTTPQPPAQPPAHQQQPSQQPPAAATTPAQAGHEYAPLAEKTINYKDWTFKSLKDGSDVNLRKWAKGKKLVMIVYFAPWCNNWKMEAPVVARLYEKYAGKGFDVVAVSEYAAPEDSRKYFETIGGAAYTVVVESEARDARDKTTHYGYRQACGDSRRWGSPFNIFLEPKKLNKEGEIVTEKAWVVGGELVEDEVEQFIRQRLGLKEEKASR
jgi:thiol-disulfide isomerase/thioredoxin